MAEPVTCEVEVAYARPDLQRVVKVTVPAGTSARQALRLSGFAGQFPEIDAENCVLGVFGQVVADGYVLRPGDRVEVYRPLARDPRDARREAATRGGTIANPGWDSARSRPRS